MLKIIGFLLAILASPSAFALDIATGKVTYIQSSGDHEAFYFKLDTMPSGVHSFYSSATSTGSNSGCNYKGSANILSKQLSTVLMAKASQSEVKLQYCKDSQGYGLISTSSGFIAVQ